MPLIDVTLTHGRSDGQIRRLISELTRATAQALDAPVENIRVIVREVPRTHWAAGDTTIEERSTKAQP